MIPMRLGTIEILLDAPDEQEYVVSAIADLRVKDGFRTCFDREFANEARAAGAALSETKARKALEANIGEIRAAVGGEVPPSARGVAVFGSCSAPGRTGAPGTVAAAAGPERTPRAEKEARGRGVDRTSGGTWLA